MSTDCQFIPGILNTLGSTAVINTTDCCTSTRYITCENQRITWLMLNQTNADGTIPASISSLSGLRFLWLHRNKLKGSIPSSLGSINTLEVIEFGRNQLSGTVPASIGSLTSLQTLYLYENTLSGPLPEELGNLTRLQYVLLEGNADLKGPMPAKWQDLAIAYDQCGGYGVEKGPGLTDYYCCNLGNLCVSGNTTYPRHCGSGPACPVTAVQPSENSGLGQGAIIGISIGAVVLVAVLAVSAFLFMRKRSKPETGNPPTAPQMSSYPPQMSPGQMNQQLPILVAQNVDPRMSQQWVNGTTISSQPSQYAQFSMAPVTLNPVQQTHPNKPMSYLNARSDYGESTESTARMTPTEPETFLPGTGVILDHPYNRNQ